jgi:serine/threonine protein kinase
MIELVGQTLGQYRIDELIGLGGMARVYKAYQPTLDRFVAIKAIPVQGEGAQERSFVERFNAEARMVAKLTHPNIVPIHDFGEDRGWAYIVMEYISSGTVRERLMQAEARHAPLPLNWVLLVLEQAARALDFAHRNGIVHRDVKPGNMLLRTDDHLLLSDFGIATILAASAAYSRSGHPVGTPQYMAPEQGIPHATVDGRADIYALGVVLFQCATNRLPFYADQPVGIIAKHIHEAPPRPLALAPGLPPRVDAIIMRAMAKDPRQRYQHAAEMADELRVAREELRLNGRRGAPTMPVQISGNGAQPRPTAIPLGVPGAPGTCFRCGAANNPQNHFCTSCGYDLSGARANVDRFLAPTGRPLRCRLTFRNGPLVGRTFTLHQDTTTIGRIGGNDIVILDGTVSRHHARLTFNSSTGQWSVEDLGSSNGTFVNRAPVKRATPIPNGAELRLGDVLVAFEMVS